MGDKKLETTLTKEELAYQLWVARCALRAVDVDHTMMRLKLPHATRALVLDALTETKTDVTDAIQASFEKGLKQALSPDPAKDCTCLAEPGEWCPAHPTPPTLS